MDFAFTDAEEALRAQVQDFIRENFTPEVLADLAGGGIGEQQRRCIGDNGGHGCSLEADPAAVKESPGDGYAAGAGASAVPLRGTNLPLISAPSAISMTP